MFTLLGLFYGFYQLVVVPKVNATESHYQIMFQAQKEQNAATSQELIKINNSLGTLNGTVEALVRERATTQQVNNSGGSFGGSTDIPLIIRDSVVNRTSVNTVVDNNGH